jgi:hypothetical protein
MLSAVTRRPRLLIVEDGNEYLDRFNRFLGDDFDFVSSQDFESAREGAAGADGLLLDLDFRRTPPGRLVDERGPVAAGLDPDKRRRLAETQGILILRQLRTAGIALPAVLFADIDDAERVLFLERTLAPLKVASSRLGIREIAALLRASLARR